MNALYSFQLPGSLAAANPLYSSTPTVCTSSFHYIHEAPLRSAPAWNTYSPHRSQTHQSTEPPAPPSQSLLHHPNSYSTPCVVHYCNFKS